MMPECSFLVPARRLAFAVRVPPLATGISALTAVLIVTSGGKNGESPIVVGLAVPAVMHLSASVHIAVGSLSLGGWTATLTAGGSGGGAFGAFLFPMVVSLSRALARGQLTLFVSSPRPPIKHATGQPLSASVALAMGWSTARNTAKAAPTESRPVGAGRGSGSGVAGVSGRGAGQTGHRSSLFPRGRARRWWPEKPATRPETLVATVLFRGRTRAPRDASGTCPPPLPTTPLPGSSRRASGRGYRSSAR